MRIFAIIATLLFSVAACGQAMPEQKFEEGKHYFRIASPVKSASDKVEVTEFFSYSCGHCFNFDPAIKAWAKTLPEGAELVQSHAIWNKTMQMYAQAFYSFKSLGILEEAHDKFFAAIFIEKKKMHSVDEIAAFVKGLGVKEEKFKKVYDSFAVKNQVSIADSNFRASGARGTPELMVAGKYRISTRAAGGQEEMLQVAKYLVDKELAAKAKK